MELIGWTLMTVIIGASSAFLIGAIAFLVGALWYISPWWPQTTSDSIESTPLPLFCPLDGRALSPVECRGSQGVFRNGQYVKEHYLQVYMACWRYPRFWGPISHRFFNAPEHTHYSWTGPREVEEPRRYDPKTGLPL